MYEYYVGVIMSVDDYALEVCHTPYGTSIEITSVWTKLKVCLLAGVCIYIYDRIIFEQPLM